MRWSASFARGGAAGHHRRAPVRPPGGHRCARASSRPRTEPGSSRTPPRRTSPAIEARAWERSGGSAASPSIRRRTSAPPEREAPITTNDADLADTVRALRHHGQREQNRHELVGCNARLPELTAAALRIKLRHLERLDGGAPPGGRSLRPRARRRRAHPRCRTPRPGPSRCGTCTRSRSTTATPWRARLRELGVGNGRALPDADPPAAGVCASRSWRRRLPRGRAQRRARALAPDVPRAVRRRRSIASSRP